MDRDEREMEHCLERHFQGKPVSAAGTWYLSDAGGDNAGAEWPGHGAFGHLRAHLLRNRVSALRKVIPDKVRLPAYITIIAAFVTVLMMAVKAYLPELNTSLGVYLPLIVVNCIILGRAEMFASKHGVVDSALDGLGMGLGFTLTLVLMGTIREVLGSGSIFGLALHLPVEPMILFITPAGGFFVFGMLMAAVVFIEEKTGRRRERKAGCAGCPSAEVCGGEECDG